MPECSIRGGEEREREKYIYVVVVFIGFQGQYSFVCLYLFIFIVLVVVPVGLDKRRSLYRVEYLVATKTIRIYFVCVCRFEYCIYLFSP